MELSCIECGRVFHRKGSHTRSNGQNFCSNACFGEYRKRQIDLQYIGKKFGNLTILERAIVERGPSYICLCDCGNRTTVRLSHLLSGGTGRTVSCGCHRRKMGKEMLAQNTRNGEIRVFPEGRYGRWAVLREGNSKRSKAGKLERHFICRCDCGTERSVSMDSLLKGTSKSCGCLHKEISREQAKRLFTTHGNSKERWYLNYLQRRHRESLVRWTPEMDKCLRKLQPVCVVCGSDNELAIDHVHPVSRGGQLRPGNAVILCKSCNSAKREHTLNELPKTVAEKIRTAAHRFRQVYQSSFTPAVCP